MNKLDTLQIRPATLEDIRNISTLSLGLAKTFVIDESLAKAKFLPSFTIESTTTRLTNPDYQFFILENLLPETTQFIGFIVIKEKNHVFHLFIEKSEQRKGYGQLLFNHVKQAVFLAEKIPVVTVNSSVPASKFYEKLGFVHTRNEPILMEGISFYPMRYSLNG